MKRLLLAFLLITITGSAHAAVIGTGCWNCRYTTEYNWPIVKVTAECISAEDGGSGMGISCRTVWTGSFFGVDNIQDCEFEGGECLYIEVHGRNERPRHSPPSSQPKVYLF